MTASALVLASFSLSALIGDLSGSLVLSDTTQATFQPAEQVYLGSERDDLTWDIETLPMAELRLSWPEQTASLSYGPRFVLRDAFDDEYTLVIHVVRATYTYTSRPSRLALELVGNFGNDAMTVPALLPPDPIDTGPPPDPRPGEDPAVPRLEPLRLDQPVAALSAALSYVYSQARWELTLAQSVGVSEQSLAGLALNSPLDGGALAPSGVPGVDPAEFVNGERVRTIFETTSAGLSYLLTRRLRSQFLLSYTISGGLRDRDRNTDRDQGGVPGLRTANASAGLTYLLSRRDDLSTTVTVTQTEASTGTDHWSLGLTESWVRRWNPDLISTLSAGVAGSSSGSDASADRTETVDPLVTASLFATLYRGPGTTWSATLGSSVAPHVNGLTGQLQTQLSAFAGTTLSVDETSVSADATAGQTLPSDEPGAARVISAGIGMRQDLFEFLVLGAQYRSIWQDFDDDAQPLAARTLPRLWTATLTLALVGPAIDF